jgi:hypothetical protein
MSPAQYHLRNIVVSVESAAWTGVWHVRCAADATNKVEAVGDEESQCETKSHEEHVDGNQRSTDLRGSNLAVVDGLDAKSIFHSSCFSQRLEHTTTLARIPTPIPEMKRPPTIIDRF